MNQGGAMELLEPQMAWSAQTTCSTPPCAAFFVELRLAGWLGRMQLLKPWLQSFIIKH
ncbi:hypothetical protein [Xanthomonas citri]|uniref:hypothetical protein n=1 Tax=Xanthomonas citri TaxID=346 RepID=UPI001CBBB300|nr:hypothetical protein [Xanthomonas citri]